MKRASRSHHRARLATGAPAATHDRRGVSISIAATGAIAAAVIAAIAVVSLRPTTPPAPESPVVRLPFEAPADVVSEVSDATISPNGTTMLFSGRGADGRRVLWLRRLDSTEATPLPDTDDAIEPFWSWDSKSIAFGAQGKLKRIDIGSKRAQVLADAPRSNSGTWNRAGVIVYCPDFGAPLYKIAADGRSQREQVTFGTGNHRYPVFLPDGKHLLYSTNRNVMLASLDSKDTRQLLPNGPAIYAPGRSQDAGWLLYVRDGVIVAHAFDSGRLELSGEPVPIAPAETATDWPRGARFSVSTTGVLAIARPATYDYQLAWFDRTGKPAGTLGDVRNVDVAHLPRVSPDGTRVIVQVVDAKTRYQDFWISEIARGTFDRMTSTSQLEQLPAWMPDSRSVMAATSRPGLAAGIFRLSLAGRVEEQIATGTIFPADVTTDGRWLLYTHRGESTRADVWVLPLTDGKPAAGAAPVAILNSEFEETGPHVSKDGRWVAYGSDVNGTPEIYVRPFLDGRVGPQLRVSPGHGIMPRWSRDGRTLFFVRAPQGTLSAQMMSVAVTPDGDTLRFGTAAPLFTARMLPISTISAGDYDITPEGKFLVGTVVGPTKGTAGTIVLNWPAIAGK